MVRGSIVFTGSNGPVDLSDSHNWWSWIPGAHWRHPEGPESTLHGRERHPVTHIVHEDACAYAAWVGKELPWQNLNADGFEGASSVGSFPANGLGLYDVCGNVWEWTSDWFTATHEEKPCCAPPARDGERFPRKAIKGGSHLCAPNYCLRYRPAARQGEGVDTSTSQIGVRCVARG